MAQEAESQDERGNADSFPDTPETLAVRREMAARLDCHLSEDVCAFYRVKPDTLIAWSKRGKGPRRIRMGNSWLYPTESLREDLAAHDRRRESKTSRSTL